MPQEQPVKVGWIEPPQIREEGSRYLIFHKGSGQYLFANEAAVRVVEMLAAGASVKELIKVLSEICGSNALRSCARLAEILATLEKIGIAPARDTCVEEDPSWPQFWTMEEVLGDAAEKCETFGMPF